VRARDRENGLEKKIGGRRRRRSRDAQMVWGGAWVSAQKENTGGKWCHLGKWTVSEEEIGFSRSAVSSRVGLMKSNGRERESTCKQGGGERATKGSCQSE
jgi:hypothetical protein